MSTAGRGRPSSCALTVGHCGSSRRRAASRQARQAVRPGTTTGPMTALDPSRTSGTCVTSSRMSPFARRGSTRCAARSTTRVDAGTGGSAAPDQGSTRARAGRREHRARDAFRKIIDDLHRDGVLATPGRQGRADGLEQGIAVARTCAVQEREGAHLGVRRARHQRGDHRVDPGGDDGGEGDRGRAELHTSVVAPERGSGGIESDHGAILASAPIANAALPTFRTAGPPGRSRGGEPPWA